MKSIKIIFSRQNKNNSFFSPVELLQNKRCLRYVQAQHSEIFHVFARRLAHALV
jgi:hypothetical protein